MNEEGGDGLVEVHIVGLPVEIWARSQEHVDDLLREFTLLRAGAHSGPHHVPERLLALVDELQRDYAGMTTDQEVALTQGATQGVPTMDLIYRVPPSTADACLRLGEALDAADEYCRRGEHLLSLATPPDALSFRRWYLGEFVGQIGGAPPHSWSEWSATHEED